MAATGGPGDRGKSGHVFNEMHVAAQCIQPRSAVTEETPFGLVRLTGAKPYGETGETGEVSYGRERQEHV
jgi:hypothetical protein